MSTRAAFGTLSNVPHGTKRETGYDVIIENISDDTSAKVDNTIDEDGKVVLAVASEYNQRNVKFSGTIIGATHFGEGALIGTVITITDNESVPTPLFVTGNSRTRPKGMNHTCEMTAIYLGDDATLQTLGTTTTTTT